MNYKISKAEIKAMQDDKDVINDLRDLSIDVSELRNKFEDLLHNLSLSDEYMTLFLNRKDHNVYLFDELNDFINKFDDLNGEIETVVNAWEEALDI